MPERAAQPRWAPAQVTAALRRTACNRQVRFLLKTGVAVAAVVMLALLFRGTTTATAGLTLAQVFQAFGKADNVHVARFNPATGRLVRELWISRSANLYLTMGGQERALYDLNGKKRCAYPTSGAPAEVSALSERECADAWHLMDACLGFTPNDVPRGAKWTQVSSGEAADVYELVYWENVSPEIAGLHKLRIAVEPSTGLPRDLQSFRRGSPEEEWRYISRIEVQYLTNEKMKATFETQHIPWPR